MTRRLLNSYSGTSGKMLMLVLLHGLGYSFVLPIMSYFIVDGLGQAPIWVGVYTVSVGISSVLMSHFIGSAVDNGADNRRLLFAAVAGFGIASFVYGFTQNYFGILLLGISVMAFGNAAIPLLLSFGRTFSVKNNLHIGRFNAALRAQISIAWILGAPLAFWITDTWGFRATFLISALICALWLVFAQRMLPKTAVSPNKPLQTAERTRLSAPVILVSAGLFFANMANSIYISAMPLYVILEHKQAAGLPGWLMALAAAIEIPVMLLASRWTHRISPLRLLTFGLLSGCFFYTGMFFATTAWQFLALQLANGFFFGTFAGLGITLIQDLLPDRVGFSSALYTNTMRSGAMMGAGTMGVIATLFSYHAVLLAAGACLIVSVLCLRRAFPQA
jgi:SET family sugar efflux transporter-like MFS transporter